MRERGGAASCRQAVFKSFPKACHCLAPDAAVLEAQAHTLARLYSAHEEGMFSARAGTRAGLSCYILHGVLVSPQCRLLKTRIRTR